LARTVLAWRASSSKSKVLSCSSVPFTAGSEQAKEEELGGL